MSWTTTMEASPAVPADLKGALLLRFSRTIYLALWAYSDADPVLNSARGNMNLL